MNDERDKLKGMAGLHSAFEAAKFGRRDRHKLASLLTFTAANSARTWARITHVTFPS